MSKKTTRKRTGLRDGIPQDILDTIPNDIPDNIKNPEDIAGAEDFDELIEYIKLAERVSHAAIYIASQHRGWIEKQKQETKAIKSSIHDDIFPFLKDISAHLDKQDKQIDAQTKRIDTLSGWVDTLNKRVNASQSDELKT